MSAKKERQRRGPSAANRATPRTEFVSPAPNVTRASHAEVVRRGALAPGSLTPRDVLQLQRAVGNRAVAKLLARAAQPQPPQEGDEQPLQKKENRTGLPDDLKAGVESLSGLLMDDVRVNYNSPRPAALRALAYTQGADIHVGPGQERYLAHEVWHVVQQKQGRVRPTAHAEGYALNEERHLEAEADVMADRAARTTLGPAEHPQEARRQFSDASQPLQLAKGGLEYTERPPNVLGLFQGTADLVSTPAYSADDMTLRGTSFKVYHVPNGEKHRLGTHRAFDATAWQDGMVKLTNDTSSPEWVIEAHGGGGVDRNGMSTQIAKMFAMRGEMKDAINNYENAHPGEIIAFLPEADLSSALFGLFTENKTFVYKMDAVSKGAAQITFKYMQKPALKRIAEANVSRYLKGGAIRNDLSYLEETSDYNWLTKKFASDAAPQAQELRAALVARSITIKHGGVTYLSAEDVGIIKLMVINDAMATLVVRFNATFGQSRDKNLQRFFPKSKRPNYVHAMAARQVPDEALQSLRQHMLAQRGNMIDDFKANLELSSIDISTIASREVAENQRAGLGAIMIKLQNGTASTGERQQIDRLIFGQDGDTFRNKLTEVIEAYTEQAGEDKHRVEQNREAVVKSMSYADVDPTAEPGAVYELRDKEISMAENDLNAINAALDILFRVV
jgi:Domain of unknown function (DUF4157)